VNTVYVESMSDYEFNGEIDGKQVKVIVKPKKEKK